MKRKTITKKNTFKKLVVNTDGRLIDATKDVTEQDEARIKYHKLQSEQFDPISNFERRNLIATYFISLSILILFMAFSYILLKMNNLV